MKTIVNYTPQALHWHLRNNCGLSENAILGIASTIKNLNQGKVTLSSKIAKNTDCTIEEMLNDLRIEYTASEYPQTEVRFYVEKEGNILAVFPKEINDRKGDRLCYAHMGQHGGAHPAYYRTLRRAYPHQFKSLYLELQSIGYNMIMR